MTKQQPADARHVPRDTPQATIRAAEGGQGSSERKRPLLAYANEAVLPFYILHQPVILLIGYFVIPLALPIAVKYLLIAPLAFGITVGLYEFGVRRWNPIRRVFGLKARQPDRQASAPFSHRWAFVSQSEPDGGNSNG
jgi:hypothetical protein